MIKWSSWCTWSSFVALKYSIASKGDSRMMQIKKRAGPHHICCTNPKTYISICPHESGKGKQKELVTIPPTNNSILSSKFTELKVTPPWWNASVFVTLFLGISWQVKMPMVLDQSFFSINIKSCFWTFYDLCMVRISVKCNLAIISKTCEFGYLENTEYWIQE